MDNVLEILDELKKDLAGKQPNRLEITFSQDDTRLSVIEAGGNILTGSLELGDCGPTDVVGVPIQEDLMRFGEKGPRHVLIYGHLSASTLVHPFWGIAGKIWPPLGNHERFKAISFLDGFHKSKEPPGGSTQKVTDCT